MSEPTDPGRPTEPTDPDGANGSGSAATPPPPPGGPAAPAPYGAPAYGAPAAPKNNGLAVAALVLGITGFLCCIPAILALVFGYISKGQIDKSNGTQTGRGMAVAGIVLGWVWVGLGILYVILVALGTISES